jgi:two-component system sensor histidine kinase/response regulator
MTAWPRRRVVQIAVVALAYYGAARLGLLLQLPGTVVSPVSPASGIALAAMMLAGPAVWPGVLVAAFLANASTVPFSVAGLAAAAAIAVGNVAEPWLAVLLIGRVSPSLDPFSRARDAIWFVLVIAAAGLVAALTGATVLRGVGLIDPSLYRSTWQAWWIADTAGMVILAPAIYAWAQRTSTFTRARLLEAAVLAGVTVLLGDLTFGGTEGSPFGAARPYLLSPVILWAGFRFGLREAATVAVAASIMAMSHTWTAMELASAGDAAAAGLGPFVDLATTPKEWLLSLQMFMCTTAVKGIVLAAAVAERDHSETALAEGEQRFRTIFEQVAVGVAVIETSTGRIQRVNQRYCDIVGRSPDDLARVTFQAITHPDDRARDLEYMRRLVTGDVRQFSFEKRYLRLDGSAVWVNLTVSPTWNEGEASTHHLAVIEDITARKQLETTLLEMNRTLESRVLDRTAQLAAANRQLEDAAQIKAAVAESLAQSEQRLKLALENARHGLWDWDVRSGDVVLDANWLALLGYRPDEKPGRIETWSDGIHPADRDRVTEALGRSLSTADVPYDVDYRALHKDGSWIWINTRGRVQNRDADGRPLRMMGTIHDITDRKRAQQVFEEQERRYRQIVDAASDIIYRTDADGHFTFGNAAAGRVMGVSTESMIGLNYLTLIRPDARPAAQAFYARQAREGLATTYYEFPAVTFDHTEVWFGQNVQLLAVDGVLVGFQGVARDITERKRMERELQDARDQAIDSTRLKSEFLANMSHEIRTPMNGVIGLADLLLDTPLSPGQRQHVDGIRGSGEALLTVINDILDFSKIEAGMLTVEQIDFDFRAMLASTLLPFEVVARRKQLALTAAVAAEVPAMLHGDPTRVRQVLTNLVGNAVKFTDSGEVAVHVTVDRGSAADLVVRCEVRDTGIGISAEAAARLFQPFVQADGSITRQFGGTGLGLAISKRLADLMGGEIGVDSRLGEGATFWLTVPLRRAAALGAATVDVGLRGRRVLVVDGNAASRAGLLQALTGFGVAADEAEDGGQAMEALHAAATAGTPFDVALLEWDLPEASGLVTARAIRAVPALQEVGLVMMPTRGHRGDAREAREAGVDAYLPKPVRPDELRACITALLAAGRSSDPASAPGALVTRHTIAESATSNERPLILVAEDNPINQAVARGQLEQLGYRVEIVASGDQAVAACANRSYGAVLMDCQMPIMDGFTATAEIRRREAGGPRLPIIALTAHAMAGERDRCLAAGMDDHLAKPVSRDQLASTMARWVRRATPSSASPSPAVDITTPAGVDLQVLDEVARQVGLEQLGAFVESVMADTARVIDRLGTNPEPTALAAIERDAHRLCGGARTLGLVGLGALFARIEADAQDGAVFDAAVLAGRLESEHRALRAWWSNTAAPLQARSAGPPVAR